MSSETRPGRPPLLARIPNALTAVRIGIACAFPFVAGGLRLGLVAAALATEFLDGQLARRFGWESLSGRLLDPIADKLLFASVAGTFLHEGTLSWWAFAAVGVRDLAIALGAAWLVLRRRWKDFRRMPPEWSGKLTTALQYAVFLVLLLEREPPAALVALTGLAGAVATVRYVQAFLRRRAA